MDPGAGLSLATPEAEVSAVPLAERGMATPRLACEALAKAINSGDLEGALSCFALGGCLVGPGGSEALGETAIARALEELIASEARVSIELFGVVVAEDTALAHEHWQVSYGGEPDPRLARTPSPTLVLRRVGGEWKVAIAAPWGAPASAPLRAIPMSN